MHRTNIYLDDEQCEMLDRVAGAEGRSRSEVIRSLIERAFGGADDDLEEDLRAIEDSFGVLQDGEPIARGRDRRSEHLDRLWHSTR
jgi:predicted DNA-binding protein